MQVFDNHEAILRAEDDESDLKAFIAIHNTSRGPSLGGCRMYPFASEGEALFDVLRLSGGMTNKSALADLDLGGGKAVIMGDPRTDKSDALFYSFGQFLNHVNYSKTRYITAEDVGVNPEDLKIAARATGGKYVVGITPRPTGDGEMLVGPERATAYGVRAGIRAAVKYKLGCDSLKDIRVAIQGCGHVGYWLAKFLTEDGARLWVTDIDRGKVDRVIEEFGALPCPPESICSVDCDVFSPCAMGSVINEETLQLLKAPIVAGSANNQLAVPEGRMGQELIRRGKLYMPDYAINAGGIIYVSYDCSDLPTFNRDDLIARLDRIGDTCTAICKEAKKTGEPTNIVADRLAEQHFEKRPPISVSVMSGHCDW